MATDYPNADALLAGAAHLARRAHRTMTMIEAGTWTDEDALTSSVVRLGQEATLISHLARTLHARGMAAWPPRPFLSTGQAQQLRESMRSVMCLAGALTEWLDD